MTLIVQRRQDIACQHTAPRTQLILEQLEWQNLLRSVIQFRYCKSDYHTFLYITKFLAYQSLKNDQETKHILQVWLQELAATFLDEGIHKLVNVVTTALFYMVTMWRCNLVQVPTFCNKDVFKNYLNGFLQPTGSYCLEALCNIIIVIIITERLSGSGIGKPATLQAQRVTCKSSIQIFRVITLWLLLKSERASDISTCWLQLLEG